MVSTDLPTFADGGHPTAQQFDEGVAATPLEQRASGSEQLIEGGGATTTNTSKHSKSHKGRSRHCAGEERSAGVQKGAVGCADAKHSLDTDKT